MKLRRALLTTLAFLLYFPKPMFGQSRTLPDKPFDLDIGKDKDSAAYYVPFKGDLDALSPYQIDWLISCYKFTAEIAKLNMPLDSIMSLLSSAERFARHAKRNDHLGPIYIQRGSIYSRWGNYSAAIRSFFIGLHYYETFGSSENISGYPYIDVGNMFFKIRQFKKAQEFYGKALQHFEATVEKKPGWGLAVATNNLALCSRELKQQDSALYLFQRAYEIRKQMQDSIAIMHSMLYLADQHLIMGHYDQVRELLGEAEQYETASTGKDKLLFRNEIDLQHGQLNLALGHYDVALTYLRNALKRDEYHNSVYFNAEVYEDLARVHLALNELDKAEDYIDTTISILYNFKNFDQALGTMDVKSKILSAKDDAVGLRVLTREMLNLQDSLVKEQTLSLSELFEMNLALASEKIKNQDLVEENRASMQAADTNWQLFLISLISGIVFIGISCWAVLLYRRARRSERIQRETNNRIYTLINSIENVILSVNYEGKIILMNKAAEAFYSKLLEKPIKEGDNFLQLLEKPSHVEMWSKLMEKARNARGPWTDHLTAPFKKPIHTQRTLSPLRDEKGDFSGLILVGTDTTKTKEQEEALQLQKTQLDEANRAKQQMLGLLAHDLKDVVYSSYNLTEIVLQTPEAYSKEELLHLFGMMHDNFGKNKNMLQGMLEWAKTQTGGLHVFIRKLNLYQAAIQEIEHLRDKAVKKGISLLVDIPETIELLTDADILKVVLRNLVNNAIKFTPPKTGIVKVSADLDGENCIIRVKDNGQGMSQTQINKIQHQPGSEQTLGTIGEVGSGFGLSICREYLKVLNSELHINSKPGHGSVFSFSLPLKKPNTEETNAAN